MHQAALMLLSADQVLEPSKPVVVTPPPTPHNLSLGSLALQLHDAYNTTHIARLLAASLH